VSRRGERPLTTLRAQLSGLPREWPEYPISLGCAERLRVQENFEFLAGGKRAGYGHPLTVPEVRHLVGPECDLEPDVARLARDLLGFPQGLNLPDRQTSVRSRTFLPTLGHVEDDSR